MIDDAMRIFLKLALACSAATLCVAVDAQAMDAKPSAPMADVLAEPLPPVSGQEDAIAGAEEPTDIVTIERERTPSAVVCRWMRRNGSNFRERRCRSRVQANREERQAEYALRRMTGF